MIANVFDPIMLSRVIQTDYLQNIFSICNVTYKLNLNAPKGGNRKIDGKVHGIHRSHLASSYFTWA